MELLADRSIDAAINLEVSVDECTARMLARGRKDDTHEAIAERLGLYQEETVPTIEWLRSQGKLVQVDGLGSEEEVSDRVRSALEAAVKDGHR